MQGFCKGKYNCNYKHGKTNARITSWAKSMCGIPMTSRNSTRPRSVNLFDPDCHLRGGGPEYQTSKLCSNG